MNLQDQLKERTVRAIKAKKDLQTKAHQKLRAIAEPRAQDWYEQAVVIMGDAADACQSKAEVHREENFSAYKSSGNDFVSWNDQDENGLACLLLMRKLKENGLEPQVKFGYDGGGMGSWYSIWVEW